MEYRKHTSLKDLAQTLGVSIPTVSRALKDSPEISSELCVKAKKLAKEMNYRIPILLPGPAKEYPAYHWSCCTGYRYPFLRIHPERDREYGSGQRILYHHHHFTRILRI